MNNRGSAVEKLLFPYKLEIDLHLLNGVIDNSKVSRTRDQSAYQTLLFLAIMDWSQIVEEAIQENPGKENEKNELAKQMLEVYQAMQILVTARNSLPEDKRKEENALAIEREELRELMTSVMRTICEVSPDPEVHLQAQSMLAALTPSLGRA